MYPRYRGPAYSLADIPWTRVDLLGGPPASSARGPRLGVGREDFAGGLYGGNKARKAANAADGYLRRMTTCFVIMGFGKKFDHSGQKKRELDLDATYNAIIKPAVVAAGLTCVRADEVAHSGVIDRVMFEELLRADVVVADISTANPNALYELGVRHALRPRSTILMREKGGQFPFDLNHVSTIEYRHLGEDIGFAEVARVKPILEGALAAALRSTEPDSPVFTFLGWLREQPLRPDNQQMGGVGVQPAGEDLGATIRAGREAMRASNPAAAAECFTRAHARMTQDGGVADTFVVQQRALATYKAGRPDKVAALEAAWEILGELDPMGSTDPETLGIGGAIQKRLWAALRDRPFLERAIELYGRGFEVKRDYYTGENYALCLDLRAAEQRDPAEADYDRRTARKVRERIERSLTAAFAEADTAQRPDYKWMLATMANTQRALGASAEAQAWEDRFRALADLADWEIQTFEEGKTYALKLRCAEAGT